MTEGRRLFLVVENRKAGYIDRKGDFVIPPQFDAAFDFHDGLARIVKRGSSPGDHTWGFIDSTGAVVIEPQFQGADDFSEDRALVKVGEKYGYIDKKGEIRIKPIFHDPTKLNFFTKIPETPIEETRFSEGLAAAQKSLLPRSVGYIDPNGEYVIEPQFRNGYRFSDGLATVNNAELNKKWGLIDRTGSFVMEPQFKSRPVFSEGLAYVKFEKKAGYIDKTGTTAVEIPFDFWGAEFHEGLARVGKMRGRFFAKSDIGYVDTSGQVVIPLNFRGAKDFHEGLAAVSLDGKRWGYIDRAGTMVIEARALDQADNFADGMARVGWGKIWGYIDSKGKTVVEPCFKEAGEFIDGLAMVAGDNWMGYIDKTGSTIYRSSI